MIHRSKVRCNVDEMLNESYARLADEKLKFKNQKLDKIYVPQINFFKQSGWKINRSKSRWTYQRLNRKKMDQKKKSNGQKMYNKWKIDQLI